MNSPEGIAAARAGTKPLARLQAQVEALGLELDISQTSLGYWARKVHHDAEGHPFCRLADGTAFLGSTEYEASLRLERMANQEEDT